MSIRSAPPERPETTMMDAKLHDIGRDLAAAFPSAAFGGDAEAMKHTVATSAAMAAFGAGMAGHAFGVWLSAVSSSLEVAQRLTALAAGTAEPAAQPDVRPPVASAADEPAAGAAAPVTARRADGKVADAADDLKAIGGIGPKLEKVLNGLGIRTYAQIAALTEAEILRLDEQLGFRGRIGRDEWLKQAAALAAAKA